jgi:beta-N-acetylhexosaminidase
MGRRATSVLLVAAIGLAAACGPQPGAPKAGAPPASRATAPAATAAPKASVAPAVPTTTTTVAPCRAEVATWTVADQLEQLLMVGGQFSDLAASGPLAWAGIGALVLFGAPAAGTGTTVRAGLDALAHDASAAGHVVPWFATDEEGGTVARLAGLIGALPSARRMAAQWTTAQVQLAAAEHGAAMRALGVDVDLAPVVDAAPVGDRVSDEADRSFSAEPVVAAAYVTAFAAGLRAGGVVAVAKHFPGLGHATADTDRAPATGPALSDLLGADLVPFARLVAAGVPAIMISHMSVPGLTDGLPASLSPATYTLLRGPLAFDGVTITDSLGAGAISAAGESQPAAAVAAIEAGADMAMIDASAWWPTMAALEHAIATGALPVSRVGDAAARVVAAKRACG